MSTRPLLVLISGKRGAGKDFFAGLLQQVSQHAVHVVPTANFVKLDYCQRFNHSLERLQSDRTYKEKHRAGLIGWAEHQKMRVSPTVWIERALTEYRQLVQAAQEPVVIAVPDFRFLVEWQYLQKHAAHEFCIQAVRVEAPQDVRTARGAWPMQTVDAHASEQELDEFPSFTYKITNDSTPAGDQAMRRAAKSVLGATYAE